MYQQRGGTSVSMLPRWTSPPQRNTEEWLRTFRINPRLAVVERIASDLSFAAGKLYRVDDRGNEEELRQHPFLDFWEKPNPLYEMTGAALWRLFEIYLMLKGEGYLIIERNVLGRPAELWPVPVHWVQMTPYTGSPFYTIRVTSGSILQVSVDDMFVMKDLDPFAPYERGLGQSEAIADEVEIDEYAAKFQKRFFYNDATPNLIIGMPGSSEEQRKRFRAEWMERFKGLFKSHGVATVNGEVTINKLSDNMKDMDMIQGRTFMRNAVLEHYGVPREIMGITESSNRSTSEAAQFIYAQNVQMPKLRRREEAINQQLLPMFGENLLWRFDDIVPRNQEFDKARALEGWNAGILTRNEARKLLDFDEVPYGDVYKTTFSDIYVGANDDPTRASYEMAQLQYGETEEAADNSEEIEIIKAQPELEEAKSRWLKALQKGFASTRQQQERQFVRATMKYFAEQQGRIKSALDASPKAEGSVWDFVADMLPDYMLEDRRFIMLEAEEKQRRIDSFILNLVDWEGEAKLLEGIFKPLWSDTYRKGAELAIVSYRIPAIKRPELSSFAKLHGLERIDEIENTTKESIRRILADGIDAGDTRETISKSIMQEMNIGAGRARVIAQTEVHTSLMTGNVDCMKAGGITSKKWLSVNDADTRESHRKLNGMTVPIDGKFEVPGKPGLYISHPGDPECKDPGEIIGCRCDVVAGDF
jgi:HK97 family phage portal protein